MFGLTLGIKLGGYQSVIIPSLLWTDEIAEQWVDELANDWTTE